MAKSRPSLGGLFRLKGKNESKIQLTGMSSYGNHTSVSSPTGDTRFSQKFAQFGNYKPKIFTGKDNVNSSAIVGKSEGSEMIRASTSGANSQDKELKRYPEEHFIMPTFSHMSSDKTRNESNVKTKENFILIGDKDKPMILETSQDSVSLDGSELPDELPGETDDKHSVVRESRSVVDESVNDTVEPTEIQKPNSKEEKQMVGIEVGGIDSNTSYESGHYVEIDESRVRSSDSNKSPYDALPYIPPPDYDEEVMTIEMSDEGDWHEPLPSDQKGLSSRRLYRVYQGDDFGQYIQEEESVYQTPSARSARRDTKRQPRRARTQNKESSKSIAGTISRALFGSNNNAETLNRRTIHDVRDSTFGDSKGRLNSVQGTSRTEGRYNRANSAHSPRRNRQSHYEQFLTSRHTKGGSLESTSDSDMDTAEDNRNIGNMDSHSHFMTTTGAHSSPNKYIKKNGIWEKLTLRFRRRSRGEVGTVN